MRTFNDLDSIKRKEVALEARAWFNDHNVHIKGLVNTKTIAIIPGVEDCLLGPGLWRAEHWAWFLDNMEKLGDYNGS